MSRGLPLVTLLLIAALSGCVASSGDPGLSVSDAPGSAEPVEFDDETGALSGIVTDVELSPLAGATLSFIGTELIASSAADGTFSFSNVAPGEYTLAAAKLGYEAAAKHVTIVAGSELSDVRLVLAPIAVVEPRVDVFFFKGYITCTIGHAAFLSEECGQGVVTDVGTLGANPNNKIDWKFNITQVDELQDVLVELDWNPGSAAASKLTLYVAHKFACNPNCGVAKEGGKIYCGTGNFGPPVMRCAMQGSDYSVKDPAKDLPWDMTARAWGAQVAATEVPNIVLEQSFTMYRSEFFGEAMADGYSAVADS
jgi:hypothetical protein